MADSRLFERLRVYPFHTDLEFANGLSIILGHPGTPATEAEMNRDDDLVLQAKCFFFSRYLRLFLVLVFLPLMSINRKEKLTPPIDSTVYKSWLASRSNGSSESKTATGPSPVLTGLPSGPTGSGSEPSGPEPAYPSSFAHIVELITTGQPIPGIQQIPDTVLAGHDSSSEKPQRRKPWEKNDPRGSPEQIPGGTS
ncbi:hypothetical protein NUU61_002472 [Penicillium alfredii]|uniref:Uncharacterized protein n=1 Tax=Penicillium alfredii TaxID=1506179 RepID=A0A9W9FSB6_9EURO|nr:uncharacterized protein NUU61_002472 [Penicillium alfredii]KAJ5105125.1 hypothetical protein NUU61_002472 [Penicillium alfredii]